MCNDKPLKVVDWNSKSLQVETGVVENFKWEALNLVLAEGYPTWTWVLRALGGRNLTTCISGVSIKERLLLNNIGLPGCIISRNNIGRHFHDSKRNKQVWLWIQGSLEFITDSYNLVWDLPITKCSICLEHLQGKILEACVDKFETFSWRSISHARLGGLTLGKWRVGTSADWDRATLNKVSTVSPRLRDVVNDRES